MSTEPKLTLDAPAGLLEDLEAVEGLAPLPDRSPWQPTTLADVDWLLETMGRLDAEAAENQALADAACQRYLDRLDRANGALKRKRDYLEGLARLYAAEHRKEIIPGTKKSRALPNGELAWRKTGGRLALNTDATGSTKAAEAELLAWAKAETRHPELVRKKEEPALAEIHKFCAPQGPTFPLGDGPVPGRGQRIPPGMHWEDEDPYGKLEVKPADVALAKVSER